MALPGSHNKEMKFLAFVLVMTIVDVDISTCIHFHRFHQFCLDLNNILVLLLLWALIRLVYMKYIFSWTFKVTQQAA